MKPPLFIECSVCGREFGSKSIQIHEPQCLQKLRRTEIAQQVLAETPPSTTKKVRRKKKASERKQVNGTASSSELTRMPKPSPVFSPHSVNSAPSFVIMATTSTSNFTTIERFNLPKIQPKSSGSGIRPCTAKLDKPRILNPEYIQYDMSLTRIDFTGQSKSSIAIMDENQNNRIQRQSTQIIQNSTSQRQGFALPNVLDGNLTVVGHQNFHQHPKQQGRAFRSSDHSKLVPSANTMTTVDSILGDPHQNQRKFGDRTASHMGLAHQSGKLWDDTHHVPNTTQTLMSLWSQEIYLMNALSNQLPISPNNTQTPFLPPLYDRINPSTGTSEPSLSPPIESIYASPNFPFFSKLSQCDLEKPLRTCFHLEKMPGHRNEFEPHQDNFVTPSASSECPQLQQPPESAEFSSNRHNNDEEIIKGFVAATGRKSNCDESVKDSKLPTSTGSQQEANFEKESLRINFKSIHHQLGKTSSKEGQQSEETVKILYDGCDGQNCCSTEETNSPTPAHQGRDSLQYWIGEPFMKQHAYFSAPVTRQFDTDTESESYYATPIGESQDEQENPEQEYPYQTQSIMAAIQELKQFIDGKRTSHVHLPTIGEKIIAAPSLESYQNTSLEQLQNAQIDFMFSPLENTNLPMVTLSEPPSADNTPTPDYALPQNVVNESDEILGCDEGTEETEKIQEGTNNSVRTMTSEQGTKGSHVSKPIAPRRFIGSRHNHNEIPGSDADDESCGSQSSDIPLNRSSSIRLKSQTSVSKRHRLTRRSSSHRRQTESYSVYKQASLSKTVLELQQPKFILNEFGDLKETKLPDLQICPKDGLPWPLNDQAELSGHVENAFDEKTEPGENELQNSHNQVLFTHSNIKPDLRSCSQLLNDSQQRQNDTKQMSYIHNSNIDNSVHNDNTENIEHDFNTDNSDSSPGGSNQTVVLKPQSVEDVHSENNVSSVGQPSMESVYFQVADGRSPTRRRSLRRPKTAGSYEDTVSMWEGIRSQTDSELSSGHDLNFNEETPPLSRPPTRRPSTHGGESQSLRISLRSSSAKPPKKLATKAINAKIQNLISNVNRVGELHREKAMTESHKQSSDTKQRPQTSPPINYPTQLSRNYLQKSRPSTSLPPTSKQPQKGIKVTSATGRAKTPRSKRSLSQSAIPRTDTSTLTKRERPMTATAFKFSTSTNNNKPHTMTVRTTFVENNRKPVVIGEKFPEIKRFSTKRNSGQSTTDDEPLELLFSVKTKPTSQNRSASPLGLISPKKIASMDQASLYKHIELHRRQALSEAQKVLAKKRAMLRTIGKEYSDSSSSVTSSPYSTPTRVSSAKNLRQTCKTPTRLLPDLSRQVNAAREFELIHKLARLEQTYAKSTRPRSAVTKPITERSYIPIPMSKRVHFSSPIQTKLPRAKVVVKPSKQLKSKSLKVSSTKRNQNTIIEDSKNGYNLSLRTSPDNRKVQMTYRQILKAEDKAETKIYGKSANNDPGGDNSTSTLDQPEQRPMDNNSGNDNKADDKEALANALENLEGTRDKVRGKEYERRKRAKGDLPKKGPVYSSVSLYFPKKGEEKMVDLKIIVRRKNKEGNFPSIDEAVGHLNSRFTYLIVDEEPLTKSSPNPFILPHMTRAKPKGASTAFALKITTSDQSTVNSLPSEEALNRFLTCYICGQTLNAKEYFDHERKCESDLSKKNEFLAEEDKRPMPQKPQGTITIQHWNEFAHDAVKSKLIRCPYCEMEFLPDRQEDIDLHSEACTNKPLPAVPPPRGLNIDEHITVQMANEAHGWVVPSTKELHTNNWNPGYERVEQYTRPATNRLKRYKKPSRNETTKHKVNRHKPRK